MWGQAVEELHGQHGLTVRAACDLLGHSRQAFYKKKTDGAEQLAREVRILDAVREIREVDPGIGGVKLWLMLCAMFGTGRMPGRDKFMDLLRRRGLMQKPRRSRSTTNSNHRFHKWSNLVKGFVPMRANQLWVSDITYIELNGGCCYLHLITDAYSKKVVGWCLAESLAAVFTLRALRMAIGQAGGGDLSGLIHHSDRGVQYCCDLYVGELQKHGILISMTEDYKPTDNGIAERVNETVKYESAYRQERRFATYEEALEQVRRFILFYNSRRPHMSIGNQTPDVAHGQTGVQKKMWKDKNHCD
ncbi:MAG: IS3 family transposase, partial [Bacteroidaceae bacterium]|nr:IS3 family transposase [Bacteroidaceae bacterium]